VGTMSNVADLNLNISQCWFAACIPLWE